LIGIWFAALAAQLMLGLLYNIRPRDPATFIVVAGLLLAVAALASFVPAWRASRVDPVAVLKGE
jgi:putative ABC transport system permease protein